MHRTIAALSICFASCMVSDPDTSEIEQHTCPIWKCGGDNSPNIHGAFFHELDKASTQTNPIYSDGFAYIGANDGNGHTYTLNVSHGKLVATGVIFGIPVTRRDEGLVGLRLIVQDAAAVQYALRIDEVNHVDYWVNGASGQPIESYRMRYFTVIPGATAPTDLCSNASDYNPDNGTLASHIHDVVLFEGERIDEHQRIDLADATNQWFSMGCAGGALAKMYLTGHVMIAAADGYATTQNQRTAILKMFSADYCGTGTAFTVTGQPLYWADSTGFMTFQPAPGSSLEARWDEHGAICLQVPRAVVTNTTAQQELNNPQNNAAWLQSIYNECTAVGHALPPCSGSITDPAPGHMVSANPPPPAQPQP